MRDASGIYTYTYDALDRMSQMADFRSQVFTYSYDVLGQRTQVKIPGGGRVTMNYDTTDQLRTLINPGGRRSTMTRPDGGPENATAGAGSPPPMMPPAR